MVTDTVDGFPTPPAAQVLLDAIDERLGQVVDWWWSANARASRDRSTGFRNAMAIENIKDRHAEFVRVDQAYHHRLVEIESAEQTFQEAHRIAAAEVREANHDELAAYNEMIGPLIEAEKARVRKERDEKRMADSRAKSAAAEARRKRVEEREARKALIRSTSGEGHRDRDLPETDRTSEVIDEGAGGGALTDDRGLHDDAGRDEGVGGRQDEVQGSEPDDRVKPKARRVNRKGATK